MSELDKWFDQQNWFGWSHWEIARAAAAWQREQDAKLADGYDAYPGVTPSGIADAIRAQGSKQANSDPHASDGGCERSKDDIPASSVRAFINQESEPK